MNQKNNNQTVTQGGEVGVYPNNPTSQNVHKMFPSLCKIYTVSNKFPRSALSTPLPPGLAPKSNIEKRSFLGYFGDPNLKKISLLPVACLHRRAHGQGVGEIWSLSWNSWSFMSLFVWLFIRRFASWFAVCTNIRTYITDCITSLLTNSICSCGQGFTKSAVL